MSDQIRVYDLVARWEEARELGTPVGIELLCAEVPELIGEVKDIIHMLHGDVDAPIRPKYHAEAPEAPLVPSGYELYEQVGIGGMGVVFRGFHQKLGREVALKFLKRRYPTESITARKFVEEARIAACLQHPGIPAVHEVGTLDDGRPYLAMKLIRGRTLAELFKEQGHGSAKWLGIFESICQAVGAAHEDGYMHRDLKPANVMIGKFGEVQVMDWGLAKKVPKHVPTHTPTNSASPLPEGDETLDTGRDRDTDQTNPYAVHAGADADATQYGQAKGTLRYMPAEQAKGELDRIDRRVDVFALGAMLCEILTGHPPLTSTGMLFNALVLAGDYSEAFTRLDKCGEDAELISLAKHCLAKVPSDRPKNASELAVAIANHRADAAVRLKLAEIGRAEATVQVAEQKKRRRVVTWGGTLLIAALVVGIAGTTIGLLKAEEETEQALRDKSKADAATNRADSEKENAVQALNETARVLDLARLGSAHGAYDNNSVSLARDILDSISPKHRNIEWGILGRQIAGSRLALEGNGGGVDSVAFSPDGLSVATTSTDTVAPVRLWDAKRGNIILDHKEHAGAKCFAWSPDGLKFATGSANPDFPAGIWSASTGKLDRVLMGHQSMVHAIAWSPDGSRIATASADSTARIFDATSGKCLHVLAKHQRGINCIAWALDSARVATASDDMSVRIWIAKTGLESKVLVGHTREVKSVAWHPDGTKLVTSAMDNTVRIWDAVTGQTIRQLVGHANYVLGVAWSRDGSRIATASGDKTARVWNADTGATLAELKGHTKLVSAVTFSADGKSIATGSFDRSARVWDAFKTGIAYDDINTGSTLGYCLARFPDGTCIVTGTPAPSARLFNVGKGETISTLSHTAPVRCIALSSDGTRIATGCDDGIARIWPVAPDGIPIELKHTGKIICIAWSQDGARLATASLDHSVRIWNGLTGEFLDKLAGHFEGVNDLAWNPTGTQLATAESDHSAQIWDTQSYRLIQPLSRFTKPATRLAWNADGSLIATGSSDKIARIWDPNSGELISELSGHGEEVTGVAWTPDGRRLVTITTYKGSNPKTTRIWDVKTGQVILELHGAPISLSISNDGTRIQAGAVDGTVRVWSPGSSEMLKH